MKFEEIIKDIKKGKIFTDGVDIYRYKKMFVERLELDLKYDDRRKPYWTGRDSTISLETLFHNDWKIVESKNELNQFISEHIRL